MDIDFSSADEGANPPILRQATPPPSRKQKVLSLRGPLVQIEMHQLRSTRRDGFERHSWQTPKIRKNGANLLFCHYSHHSHSILSMHRNALVYKHNFFLTTVKTRPSSRQNFSLLISKDNSRDSDFARF